MTNLAGMADDIPAQFMEPWRKQPQCQNCPFSERDADDGKLYCHETGPKAQAVFYFKPPEQKKPVLAPIGAQPIMAPELVVHGIVTFWPEVQPDWVCWQHPAKQEERRRLGFATLPTTHTRQPEGPEGFASK
jgi:hypothetical protein